MLCGCIIGQTSLIHGSLVINSAAMFADTDMSVKGKQNLLRCTHLTEIPLARAYLTEINIVHSEVLGLLSIVLGLKISFLHFLSTCKEDMQL